LARSAIRPTTPADAPALAALMAEVGLRPNSEPAHLDWKYWRERPDWPGPRSFVMARGDEILAHAAFIPGACLVCGPGSRAQGSHAQGSPTQRVRTRHVIDWAARSTATGAGVSLMKYLGQGTDALLAIGGSAQTRQLLPHLGFRAAGKAGCFVRTLHPLRILTRSQYPAVKLLPRLARSAYWKMRAPSGYGDDWRAHHIGPGELPAFEAVLPTPRLGLAVFERSAGLFRYALECPIATMGLYALEKAGQVRGYFLLAFALRQARLADCWIDSDDPAQWSALIQCAAATASEHPDAAELAAWASDEPMAQRLRECGFHERDELPVKVLAARNPELTESMLRVQMLDNDAAYRHPGRNEFWA